MQYLKRFILMFQFFTRLPITVDMKVATLDFGKGLIFAPIVGFGIGGVLAGAMYLLDMLFPLYVSAIIIVIIYIIITGGLHLDGLGDTFDGIFSNRPKERILEIMRDSRVGTNAVLAVISVLALDTALICSADKGAIYKMLLLMPVAGRVGSLVGAGVSKYARMGEGLGKSFIEYCGVKEIIIGLIPFLLIFYCVGGIPGLVIAIPTALLPIITVKLLGHKIGGATGDILGAVCELNQTLFLFIAYITCYLGYRL
jgi:adenosylcobinamide-GDP ribazoletransferase